MGTLYVANASGALAGCATAPAGQPTYGHAGLNIPHSQAGKKETKNLCALSFTEEHLQLQEEPCDVTAETS